MASKETEVISREEVRLKMRALWSDRAKYTAMAISSSLSGFPYELVLFETLRKTDSELSSQFVKNVLQGDISEKELFRMSFENYLQLNDRYIRDFTLRVKEVDVVINRYPYLDNEKSWDAILVELLNTSRVLKFTDDTKNYRELYSEPVNEEAILKKIWLWYNNANEFANFISKSEFAKRGTKSQLVYIREGLFKIIDYTILQIILHYKKNYYSWVTMMNKSTAHCLEFSDIITNLFLRRMPSKPKESE
jgi:hypothetical protein